MFFLHLLLLAAILPLCALGPGLWLLQGFSWPGPQRLCAAVGLSLLVVYLIGTALYLLNFPPDWAWAITVFSAFFLFLARGELARLWRHRPSRRLLVSFFIVLAWGLLLMASVRVFTGGFWSCDWLEHYDRSSFFLIRPDPAIRFQGTYTLSARPPMMNILAAQCLAQTGDRFEFFLVTFTFLNALLFLAAAAILPHLARRGRRGLPILLCLFLLSPTFAQNVTFSWTKLLCAFYLLLAVGLYLDAWRKADRVRTVAAFAAAAAACLVHYSAGPYTVFLAAHYLLVIFPKRRDLRELAAVALAGAAVLATWFAWSIALLGFRATFLTNTTATGSADFTFTQNLWKIAVNLFHTLVPFIFRPRPAGYVDALHQPNTWGFYRDYFFLIYQVNLLPMIGVAGGLTALYCLLKSPPAPRSRRRFWLAFTAVCLLLGVASVGAVDDYGVAHVMLLPLVFLALALLAARFHSLPRPLRLALAGGAAADLLLGVFPQFAVERLSPLVQGVGPNSQHRLLVIDNLGLSRSSGTNIAAKYLLHLTFLADHWPSATGLTLAAGMAISLTALIYLAAAALRPARSASASPPVPR